jgi:hypothetical protein
MFVQQSLEPLAIAVFDRAVGEDERRLRQVLDVRDELGPRVEAVAAREL